MRPCVTLLSMLPPPVCQQVKEVLAAYLTTMQTGGNNPRPLVRCWALDSLSRCTVRKSVPCDVFPGTATWS